MRRIQKTNLIRQGIIQVTQVRLNFFFVVRLPTKEHSGEPGLTVFAVGEGGTDLRLREWLLIRVRS